MNICFETPTLHQDTAIALGTFDGLHLGHRQVILAMIRAAQNLQLQRWVYTFKNHPAEILRPQETPALLSLWQEKNTLLQKDFELEGIVFETFDRSFSEIQAETFVIDYLVKKMRTKHITVGYNFRFGYQARGDAKLLQQLGQELGFGVEVVPAFKQAEQVVSSTRARDLIQSGAFEQALPLLQNQYLIQGKVVSGQGIAARLLGVPTANLEFDQAPKQLPPKGVYACHVRIAGSDTVYKGVLNLGIRPTFDGASLSLEVYLMDFSADLYGQVLEVYPTQFLRPEQRFEGPDALKSQIHQDIEQALHSLSG